MFSNGNRRRSVLRIYSCTYWHAKERMGFLTDSRCRYWFNKAGQSFRIGQIYRVAVKEERSTNESVSLFLSLSFILCDSPTDIGMNVCSRSDIYRFTYTTWHYCRINSSSTFRRHDSIEEYMALIRKCVDDMSKNWIKAIDTMILIHIRFALTICCACVIMTWYDWYIAILQRLHE